MPSLALSKFQVLAKATSGEEASGILFGNPVLMADFTRPEFEAWAQNCPPEMRPGAQRALGFIAHVVQDASEDPRKYPVGAGPLEPIIRGLVTGETSEPFAREQAAKPEVCTNLSPVYVAALSRRTQAQANHGEWKEALLVQKVILAAIDARRQADLPEQDVMEMIAAVDYSIVVARSVWEFADGRLFRDAAERAKAIAETETPPWHEPGEVEFSLGVLHLDPYISRRTTANFDQQIAVWRRRPVEELGVKLSEADRKNILMPEPLKSFREASKYFLASAKKRQGGDRGLSLKGYLEAEAWKQVAGGKFAKNLNKTAAEAKSLLADERYEPVRAMIDSLTRFLGLEPVDGAEKAGPDWLETANELLSAGAAKVAEERGLESAMDFMGHVASAIADVSPDLAFALWHEALPLAAARDETTRKGFFSLGLGRIRAGLAHPDTQNFYALTPLKAAEQCQAQASAEHWPAPQLAATLLSIAVNSQEGDHEAEGLQVLQMAASVDGGFGYKFQPQLLWLAGVLHRGVASTAFYAKNFEESVKAYAMSARRFLGGSMPAEAQQMMTLGADIVAKDDSQITNFIAYFGFVIPELERQGGAPVVRQIWQLCRKWIPQLAKTGELNAVVLMLLLDAVKGSAFTSELRGGGGFEWIDSDESQSLIKRIEQARAIPGSAAEMAGGTGILSDDDLLTMYAEDEEMEDGDSPAAVLNNLEVGYDAELHKQLSSRASNEREWLPVPDSLAAALGPETVLVTYYSGVLPNGNAGLYINLFTQNDSRATLADFGIPGMQVLMNKIQTDILGLAVTKARQRINDEPEDGFLSAEGRKALATGAGYVGGPTGDILRELHKQGKWHLCIQPHGPLHFFPFHLVPYEGGTLAENWLVTYLPNVSLLDPEYSKPAGAERPVRIASFGLEFTDGVPHGLPELPGAEDEAQVVASAYGMSAATGSAATETTLTEALTSARRIHVATHGLHQVSAPSFQRMFLSPDAASDGILYAYELLRHDLRGLDLLTLSACETALGRVDIGDNLRGLPANALIAGTATVVGTLWPVENSAAKTFFGSLHKELAGGAGKREAFRTAQNLTRSRHPQFRDWGAFCYSGRW